jgi:microcystin-dependent protein
MFDESFVGLVIPYAGIYPPAGWMFCQGQELPIYKNENLFSVIGTSFGGNGSDTFALPNLCGRVAVHAGQASQTYYTPGVTGGNETVSLLSDNLPVHHHQIKSITGKPHCTSTVGTVDDPTGHFPAPIDAASMAYSTATNDSDLVKMGSTALSLETPVGPPNQSQLPMPVMSPYLTMNYIICLEGIFAPRG